MKATERCEEFLQERKGKSRSHASDILKYKWPEFCQEKEEVFDNFIRGRVDIPLIRETFIKG